MISPNTTLKLMTGSYLILFLAYLFLPLIFMAVVAFNASSIPQVSPWEGFTFKWFAVLFADRQMWRGVFNSLIVGVAVVLVIAGVFVIGRRRRWFFTRRK